MPEGFISHHAGACLLRFFARQIHCTACAVWTEGPTPCYSAVEYRGPKGSARRVADRLLCLGVAGSIHTCPRFTYERRRESPT